MFSVHWYKFQKLFCTFQVDQKVHFCGLCERLGPNFNHMCIIVTMTTKVVLLIYFSNAQGNNVVLSLENASVCLFYRALTNNVFCSVILRTCWERDREGLYSRAYAKAAVLSSLSISVCAWVISSGPSPLSTLLCNHF